MKTLIAVLLVCVAVAAQGREDLNWTGWGDTNTIVGWRGTDAAYSRVFQWSSWNEKDLAVLFNDTAKAGFIKDSVAFFYWVEVGRPLYLRGRIFDTLWTRCMTVDTVRMTAANAADSARFTATMPQMGSDGLYAERFGYIDTVNIAGWAYNSHNITTPWGVYMRVGFRGITGNRTAGGYVPLFVSVGQRAYMPTRNR